MIIETARKLVMQQEMEINHALQERLDSLEWRLKKYERAIGITSSKFEVIKSSSSPGNTKQ